MLIFENNFSYVDPLNIVFLCGSHFDRKNRRDKRTILKNYIEANDPQYCAIILEENFQFKSTNKQYLAYDNIFLKGLAHVEQLAALYANKIIIIHETVSTAAELGMFAIDASLANKTCLLVSDTISIEEDKVGKFIQLAFLKEDVPETKVHLIRYYPDTEIQRTSPNKSDYHTFFHNDMIGDVLGKKIMDFLHSFAQQKKICFKRNRYGSESKDVRVVDYHEYSANKELRVSVHIEALKIQLLSLLALDEIRRELREEKEIHEHVTCLMSWYSKLLRNTIETQEGKAYTDCEMKVFLKDTNCSLRQAVGYFLYMLQATNLIRLVQKDETIPTVRKVQFNTAMEQYKDIAGQCIKEGKISEFGRLGI